MSNVGRCVGGWLAALLAAGCALPEATKNQSTSSSSATGSGGSGAAGGAGGTAAAGPGAGGSGGSGGSAVCDGALDWLEVRGGDGNQRLTAFAVHPDGLAVAGVHASAGTNFGSGPLPSSTEPYDDMFVATFDHAAVPIDSRAIDAQGQTLNAFGMATSSAVSAQLVLVGDQDGGFVVDDQVTLGGTENQIDAYALRFDGLELAPDSVVASPMGVATEHFQRAAFDGSNRLLVTGWLDDSIMLPSGALTAVAQRANFIARLDAPAWALALDTNADTDRITDLAMTADNGVVIAGTYYQALDIGTKPLPQYSFANSFLARLDEAGTVVWAHGYGGQPGDSATVSAVEIAEDGAIAVVGWFFGQVALGPAAGETLHSNGLTDVFVAVFEPGGALRWAKSFGGTQAEDAHDVVFDGCGSVVALGTFTGEVDFDGDLRSSTADESPVLVALDAATGARRWVRVLGVPGFASGCGPSKLDASPCYLLGRTPDAIYVAGSFRGALGYDERETVSANELDVFLARIPAR